MLKYILALTIVMNIAAVIQLDSSMAELRSLCATITYVNGEHVAECDDVYFNINDLEVGNG